MLSERKTARPAGRPGLKTVFFLVLLLGIFLSGLPAQDEDEEEVAVFKGAGIHLRLNGGYCLYSGGDFRTGVQGMYDWAASKIVSGGFTLGQSKRSPLNSGYEFDGDIVYYFAGRLGIGFGGSLVRVNKLNEQYFRYGNDLHDYSMRMVPSLDILFFRLSVFYAIPINRLLTVVFNAGPAYYSVDYTLTLSLQEPNYKYALSQGLKAKKLGVQGGIGLEFRMNQRLGFILEAQGRYVKVSGFDGKEQLEEYLGGPISTAEKDGLLYYLEKEGFPRLEIFPEPPASGFNSREAVFDFSGVSFRAGLNFKF
jgi:hypothetical protein